MTSSWWEIQVLADPILEDLVFWRLQSEGCQGTVSQPEEKLRRISGYLPQQQFQPLDLGALSLRLRQDALAAEFSAPRVTWRAIHEEDWATSWQQYWHPQPVGERLLIYPAWLTPPETSNRLLLRLNPGVAFGTGNHPTTQLCLESLEMHLSVREEEPVAQPVSGAITIADIGCGSGILGIAALLLGAQQVYAVDTDPLAVASARSSRDLNLLPPIALVVEQGSVAQIPQVVDGIVCNILAEVIIQLLPEMTRIAQTNTWGIFSGILVRQTQQVTDALAAQGWQIGSLWKRDDWACINARFG